MTMKTVLCLSLFGFAAAAVAGQNESSPKLACNIKAIPAEKRLHYNDLIKRLRTAVRERREVPHGYVFTIDGKAISLMEAGEWMDLERLCCPFLNFQLSLPGKREDWLLELTGPAGVKALIEEEFPVQKK